MAIQPPLLASGMPARPARRTAEIGLVTKQKAFSMRSHFRAITSIYGPALACELLEFRRLFRVPPTTANDDAFGHDLAVADQVLADDVNVVELALLDRDQGGVSDAPRLEAAEFGTPQRHRRVDRRSSTTFFTVPWVVAGVLGNGRNA